MDYVVTGDGVDWLSLRGVSGIIVELTNQTDTESAQNLSDVRAILDYLVQEVG